MIRRTVLHAKRHGMLRNPVDISIDEHDIPFHAKCINMVYALGSRGKKGTHTFNRLATVHCVTDGQRLTLGMIVVQGNDKPVDVVRRLLDMCVKSGVRISSLTMDRGYYATNVLLLVQSRGINMVMPAVKYKNIAKKIELFDAGEIGAISEYPLSSDKESTTYTLVIIRLPKKNRRKMTAKEKARDKLYQKQAKIKDHYFVFATTMPVSAIKDPHYVAKFYKRRWGIENSYKSYESMRPMTTSTNLSVRVLMWFFPVVLYNLWIVARFLADRARLCLNGRIPFTLSVFVGQLLDPLEMQVRKNGSLKPP